MYLRNQFFVTKLKIEIMKARHHLLVFLICLGIFLFDWFSFPEIRNQPYMIGLFIVVGLVGYWNMILSISKGIRFN